MMGRQKMSKAAVGPSGAAVRLLWASEGLQPCFLDVLWVWGGLVKKEEINITNTDLVH